MQVVVRPDLAQKFPNSLKKNLALVLFRVGRNRASKLAIFRKNAYFDNVQVQCKVTSCGQTWSLYTRPSGQQMYQVWLPQLHPISIYDGTNSISKSEYLAYAYTQGKKHLVPPVHILGENRNWKFCVNNDIILCFWHLWITLVWLFVIWTQNFRFRFSPKMCTGGTKCFFPCV